MDEESGWAYNRFRYYNPTAGIYNAQDPLGLAPRIASAQGYVDHAAHWSDFLGLKCHEVTMDELNGVKGLDKYTKDQKKKLMRWLNDRNTDAFV